MTYSYQKLAIVLLCLSSISAYSSQEGTVYRWVDEDGNVHFSDFPKSENATLVTLKKSNLAVAEPLPAGVDPLIEVDEPVLAQVKSDGDNEDAIAIPNTAEACLDLKVVMSKVERELKSGNSERAQDAQTFLARAGAALEKSDCQ